MYNLVEATISLCVTAIEKATSSKTERLPGELSESMKREWVRSLAETHVQSNPETRLDKAVALCNHLVDMLPVNLIIDKASGGNWDDEQISTFTKRLGIDLNLSPKAKEAGKKHVHDEMGALKLIKTLRNKLAHSNISFGECGDGITATELTNLKENTVCYLKEVINSFSIYLDECQYLSKKEFTPAK